MLFSNRSFIMSYRLFILAGLVVVFGFGASAYAQEETTSTQAEVAEIETTSIQEVADPIVISGVETRTLESGAMEVSWDTSALAASSITIFYDESQSSPKKTVQNILASGNLSQEHAFVLRGLEPGEYPVALEVVGVDLSRDRYVTSLVVPQPSAPVSTMRYLVMWFISLSLLTALFSAYEIIRHRIEFRHFMKIMKKNDKPESSATKKTKSKAATSRKTKAKSKTVSARKKPTAIKEKKTSSKK